ncbi:MAG: thioredoxin family protein [Planctomycetota bacterium]
MKPSTSIAVLSALSRALPCAMFGWLVAVAGAAPARALQSAQAAPPLAQVTTGGGQAAQEKPAPRDLYDEAADANVVVAAAVARAARDNKRVLLQWGADWCGWCHLLNDAFKKDSKLARKLMYEYEVVHVDIGKWDKHLDLAAKLGAGFKGTGVPYLTILDGRGVPLVNTESGVFECPDPGNGLRHDPEKLLAFLTLYEAKQRDSAELYSAALTDAAKSDRVALVTFGAPWCGWCHRFEDWARSEAVAPVLGKDFVFTKIDVDRTIGGKELLAQLRGPKESGIPWFAFVDGNGKVLATSTTADGSNLGCPWSPEEKAAFEVLLTAHSKRVSAAERGAMLALLGEQK